MFSLYAILVHVCPPPFIMLYDFQFNIYGQRKKREGGGGGRGTIEDEEKKKGIEIELDKVE